MAPIETAKTLWRVGPPESLPAGAESEAVLSEALGKVSRDVLGEVPGGDAQLLVSAQML